MKQAVKQFGFWAVSFLLWELVLHLTVYRTLSPSFLLVVLFTLPSAAILTLLSNLLPRRNMMVQYLLLAAFFLSFAVQVVYYRIFGTLLSLSFLSMGGQAVGGFLPTVLSGIRRSLLPLILLALPFPFLYLLHRRGITDTSRRPLRPQLCLLAAAASFFLLALAVAETADGSLYRDTTATVDRQAERFGLLTAQRLELKRLNQSSVQLSDEPIISPDKLPDASDPTPEDSSPAENQNIIAELDFEKLNSFTENKDLLTLNQFFSSRSATEKNEYTGLFEGYNLIQICAEAFSPYLIDPELTPTLYRLSTEGFVFENFYTSFPSLTTNGEYSLSMGLMPDMSRLSFATSIDNYLPFCLGNRFRAEGIDALAYHNNIGTFYNRVSTHTNMGYTFKGINYGLDMERLTPSSDLVMMEKTVDEYIGRTPFVVHYMTYSGHAEYNFSANSMSIKNRGRVADLDCSEELRAYYACQLELEDALSYLLQRLEEAGVAERTVIVLTADHYPYGLSDAAYQELAGEAANDPFWRYRSSLFCWNGGLEEPIVVEDCCCTQDVLPTILNLFGLSYDSRLLTGVDILSDSTHIALLQDGSFLNEAMLYDSSSDEITWLQPEEEYPAGYADQLKQTAKNAFAVSAAILRTDYYNFAFTSLGLDKTNVPEKSFASYIDTAGTWYEEAVETLTGRGALKGTTSGSFNGDEPATRATFLTMLTRILYLDPAEEALPFADLQVTDWYYDSFSSAWAAGLLRYDEETCRPNEPLSAADACLLLTAAAEYAGIADPTQWVGKVVLDTMMTARRNNDSVAPLSRGSAAALLAPLVEITA